MAIEVATEVDEDVEENLSIEVRILQAISHLAVVKILEAEDEADFNNEVTSLNFSVIIVINLVTSVTSVDLQKWKKEVILQHQKKTTMWVLLCFSHTKDTRKARKMFGILIQAPAII